MHSHNHRVSALQELLERHVTGFRTCQTARGMCRLKLHLCPYTELKTSETETCLRLIEETSGDDYRASRAGWNLVGKKSEMQDENMIYLLVQQDNTEPLSRSEGKSLEHTVEPSSSTQIRIVEDCIDANVLRDASKSEQSEPMHLSQAHDSQEQEGNEVIGFISFMFTYDDSPNQDRQVVYIYEIHLHANFRGYGLGSRLIKFVELGARHCGISKTMLTVFTANKRARLLYEKLGYSKDECSPQDRIIRSKTIEADYQIMSKNLLLYKA